MRCPFCGKDDTQVKDSRPSDDGLLIKRRRSCTQCSSRFNTLERIQLREFLVIKKNNERRPFDRDKLTRSINLALRKRSSTPDQIELIVNNIIRGLESLGESEISSSIIGELVMEALEKVDKVAYVRFASVYKDFCETKDFEQLLEQMENKQEE